MKTNTFKHIFAQGVLIMMFTNLFLYELKSLPALSVAILAMFAIVAFRYFLVAGFFYFYFHVWRKDAWLAYKVNQKPHNQGQFKREIYWSLLTSFVFAVVGSAMLMVWQAGYTQIYTSLSWQEFWYMPLSLLLAMLLHETYYYWLHRLMHYPKLYRLLHKIHHESLTTSPWTAFSFQPSEAFLEALALPLIACILPIHYGVLVVLLTFMTLSSVINHLNIEIYPQGFQKHWFGKWWIGATHHALHHKEFHCNYGLYFTFWDSYMHTESPRYKKHFSENEKKTTTATAR